MSFDRCPVRIPGTFHGRCQFVDLQGSGGKRRTAVQRTFSSRDADNKLPGGYVFLGLGVHADPVRPTNGGREVSRVYRLE